MTTPENSDVRMSEASPYQLAHELLGRSALTGEQNAAVFNSMREQAGVLARAFAAIMREQGCIPRTAAYSPYADGENRIWVVRTAFRLDDRSKGHNSKYGGGEEMSNSRRNPITGGNEQHFYDIVVDGHGNLNTADLNYHDRRSYDGLSRPNTRPTIEELFGSSARQGNAGSCRTAINELTRDLETATRRYTTQARTGVR